MRRPEGFSNTRRNLRQAWKDGLLNRILQIDSREKDTQVGTWVKPGTGSTAGLRGTGASLGGFPLHSPLSL